MENKKIASVLESLLLVSPDPLPLKKICEVIPEAQKKEIREALEELARRWERKDRGLRVVEVAGGWQFQTAPENAVWVGRLLQSRPLRLSRPSLETLAIIAYKQPVTRAEIEEVRGVDSGGVLKTLLDNGFIKIMGRKDVPGKPLIYATDKRFMEFFRLKSLSELPSLRDLEELQEERLAEESADARLPLEDRETPPPSEPPDFSQENSEGAGYNPRMEDSTDHAGPEDPDAEPVVETKPEEEEEGEQ